MLALKRPERPRLYDGGDLLERLRARDGEAQAVVRAAESGRLFAIAVRTLGSPARAETLVADLFTDFFFDAVDRVRAQAAIPAYLRAMVVRRSRREVERLQRYEELHDEPLSDGRQGSLDERLDREAWLRRLAICTGELTPNARTTLRLHFTYELSLQQVGDRLGRSKQAVHKTVQKALVALRSCLGDAAVEAPGEAP